MSIRLLIGRSGTGKTTFCINEMQEKMKHDPNGDPIIYLVPEQMTFLSEYKLISTPDLGGMIRTQVYSFSRLAWRILQETGGISRYHINSVGVSMLIRKIIEDKKEELKLFEKAADKNGFIVQMEMLLTEFKRYLVKPEELATNAVANDSNEKVLQDKLHDLEIIYQAFEDAMFDKYIDSEDYLKLLGEQIASSTYLQNASIYIDGFYSFTPQEYMIIEQLMKHCKEITVSLTLDRPFHHEAPDELHLFRMSGETCQTLYEMAKVEGLQVEEILFQEQFRLAHDSLQHVETFFDHRPSVSYEGTPLVHLAQAVNRRAEVEGIARTIRKLAREEDYRYRDIAILLRNGQEYHDLIENIFTDYEIPVFIDQKRTMLNHPLVELIRSSLEVINGFWRYEPVFRAVKTELLFPEKANPHRLRAKMDQLENYVLEHGIQGGKWTKKERWKYRRFKGLELENVAQTDVEKEREDELHQLRTMISDPILRLTRRLKKAVTGRELCGALYQFLEELDIPAKLENWKLKEEEAGNLIQAREHDQAWNGIIDLLDQFVEMLGEEEIPLKKFAAILDAGMESLRFSLVPPAIDQVLVADLEKSRLTDIKIAFVIGLNEGVLPAKFSEDGLFADEERERLVTRGIEIAPSSRKKLLDEEFLAYNAFTTASDRIYVSYPLANDDGKALMPSLYIHRLIEMFPQIQSQQYIQEISELSELEQLEYISHEETGLSLLTTQLQLKKRNYPIYEMWWDLYNFYVTNPNWSARAKKVLQSLNFKNESTQLSEDTSKELYSDVIQGSVSRMELFSSCPFSHFAQHGLKLRERQVFRLEAPDIGELFHGALKYIVETVMVGEKSWDSMTQKEIEKLAKEAVELLAPKLQHEILLSSNRHHYIKRKLEEIIKRASLVLQEHAKASGFAPVGLELGFGPKQKLPPLKFSLRNGTKMELIGRIDRVDKAEDEKGVFLRIMDYKSSAKDVNLNEVYYGLALQMLTYLDIVITNSKVLIGKEADPAGVLYFHVHNPLVNTSKMLTLDELDDQLFKKFKMNGLVLGEEKIIRMMDRTIETGDSSIIAAGIKKDGTLTKRSKVASIDEFDQLRRYVRHFYVKTGNAIAGGDVQISPYKLKDRKPCTFCSFKSVCQFDESLEANDYRNLPAHSKEDILQMMRKEEGNDEDTN
ncbi:helicase-exonuclease AddAB subunit AddB [Robertmurraya massiliosenegalensis]|uniref:helicase-exonuclease AddAB subunit AddB n=1 Tax=Robertmurraya massiliosenegalensis TaxID=1287657 RepID=UPI00031EC244|nr:helicase-exonuclease AddAB subunit AddB [Robertmurraya massiliosenegalensis]